MRPRSLRASPRPWPLLLAFPLFLLAAAAGARPAAAQDAPRLLTGLSAEVTAEGVTLTWTVDESRAHRIRGFNCVYRTPGHIATGVGGAVPCEPLLAPAGARGRLVTGLPEYGDYDFEVAALETKDGPGIPWTLRALRFRVTVTEELAGPPGPDAVVTGAGPLVVACRPAESAEPRPWSLDETVSDIHLTHYPGNGWTAGGDPDAPPDWPEPRPIGDVVAEAGLDPAPLQDALSGEGVDQEALQRLLADERFARAITAIGAGTKALLRPGPSGGYELRLHSSYPFGDDYAFGPEHAVPGWGDADSPLATQLWQRVDCPPANRPDATHDVALALSTDAGGERQLEHAGYGWWTVAPVGLFPHRIVATKGAISYGDPSPAPPEAGTRWRGRASGHLFWDERRWALSGEVELWTPDLVCVARPRLAGRIVNVALTPLDPETLEPLAGETVRLPDIRLDSGRARAQDGVPGNPWTGAAGFAAPTSGALEGFPAASAFSGDWLAAAHGPRAGEVAGRLRLWTAISARDERATEWTSQALLVVGFGAVETPGDDR